MNQYAARYKKTRPADGFISLIGGVALLNGDARKACLAFCEQHRALVLDCLPGSLHDVVSSTSFSTMLDIVSVHGGKRLYLPTRADRFYEQTGLSVPPSSYSRWREHGDVNGQIDIPSVWGLFLALRRAAIRAALAHDWSPEALHSTFGITRRQLKAYRVEKAGSAAAHA
jgi:hypothetical protein